MNLPENIDGSGRLLRFIGGLTLLAVAYWQSSWIIFAFALFTFFEAYMSWCVVYHILGKNSCSIDKRSKK